MGHHRFYHWDIFSSWPRSGARSLVEHPEKDGWKCSLAVIRRKDKIADNRHILERNPKSLGALGDAVLAHRR